MKKIWKEKYKVPTYLHKSARNAFKQRIIAHFKPT